MKNNINKVEKIKIKIDYDKYITMLIRAKSIWDILLNLWSRLYD